MPYATNYFTGDGTTTRWPISFAGNRPNYKGGTTPYFNASDIKAATITTNGNGEEIETALPISVVGASQVDIIPAVASGVRFKIYRLSNREYPLSDFTAYSDLTEQELNDATRQTLFAVQELDDQVSSSRNIATSAKVLATSAARNANYAKDTADAAASTATSAASKATQAAADAETARKAAQAADASAIAKVASEANTTAKYAASKADAANSNVIVAIDKANAASAQLNNATSQINSMSDLAKTASSTASAAKSAVDDMTYLKLPLGGDAWQVRNKIGLSNDSTGRGNLGLGTASTRNASGDGDVMAVGFGGLGSRHLPYMQSEAWKLPSGFYGYSPDTEKVSNSVNGWGVCLNLETDGPDWRSRMYFDTSGRVYTQQLTNDTWLEKTEVMLKGRSCTVDSNGFLKQSSPIVRLGSTTEDSGFTLAGCGVVNDEAKGVICKRLEEGKYEVSGSLGFAKDNHWAIELPQDANKQVLLWVHTTQKDDGTLVIETYHRTYPDSPPFARNIRADKKDGDPVDIPAGRWIDLRLEMEETKPKE